MIKLHERPDSDFGFDSHLPPLDAWKINPKEKILKKFYVPTDDRGFVMMEEATMMVKDLIEDDYEWPVNSKIPHAKPNSHHFQWYAQRYAGDPVARIFRESRQGVIVNQAHRLLHECTLPPNIPKRNHMRREVAVQALKLNLLLSAEELDKTHGLAQIVDQRNEENEDMYDIVLGMIDRKERGLKRHLEALKEHPSARHIDLSDLQSLLHEGPYTPRVVSVLGDIALKSTKNYMHLFKCKRLDQDENLALAG